MKIESTGVTMSLGGKSILKGIDFTLQDGEILGIIGPNGGGKSTFLKCVYRTLHPDAGIICMNDRNIDDMSYKETACQLAVVAQHGGSHFDFTVIDMVLMGRFPYKKVFSRDTEEDYALAEKALAQVGMVGRNQQSFSTLSGGEQQRVMLARALAQNTKCLILDEPTNHLDIRYQLEMMQLIQTLGITTAIAVHDLNIAAKYCHRLVAIQDGLVVGMGAPRELLTESFIYQLYGVKASIYFLGNATYPHIVFEGV